MSFKVDRTPAVNQQLHELSDRAISARIHGAFADALREMLGRLLTDPLDWGDPVYNAKHPGGVICHAMVWPLQVRYTVFQIERVVIIFEIRAWPNSPLADS